MNLKLLSLCAVALLVSACAKTNPSEEGSNQLKDGKLSVHGTNGVTSSVPTDTARTWVSNYQNWLKSHNALFTTQNLQDGTTAETPNSRTVWFSVEQMEKIVNKTKAAGGDGIRFYFARYNSQPSFINECTGEKLNYSGMNTLLMVPTKKDNCSHRDLTDYPGTLEDAAPIENRGEICPPPANCNSIGATLLDSLEN